MVGTIVRESTYEASMAKITAMASGAKSEPAIPAMNAPSAFQ